MLVVIAVLVIADGFFGAPVGAVEPRRASLPWT